MSEHAQTKNEGINVADCPSSSLQETTLLQQPCHFLVFSFSWLTHQALIPELITVIDAVRILVKGLIKVSDHWTDDRKVVRLCLPSFYILNNFGSLLTFTEVHHLSCKSIFRAIVDKSQGRQVDA